MNLFKTLGAAALLLLVSLPALAEPTPFDDAVAKTPDELMKGIENQHPMIYFVLAGKLYDANRREEATFWLYAGQLRYRFRIETLPEAAQAQEKAVFTEMTRQLGGPINIWAFGDTEMLASTVDAVLAWDEKAPNGFTAKADFVEQWHKTRQDMADFGKYLRENGDKIRADRAKKGWENRN